ncbi:MAG: ankyrin repeat domain-containing protein [Bacteroidota bacterium]
MTLHSKNRIYPLFLSLPALCIALSASHQLGHSSQNTYTPLSATQDANVAPPPRNHPQNTSSEKEKLISILHSNAFLLEQVKNSKANGYTVLHAVINTAAINAHDTELVNKLLSLVDLLLIHSPSLLDQRVTKTEASQRGNEIGLNPIHFAAFKYRDKEGMLKMLALLLKKEKEIYETRKEANIQHLERSLYANTSKKCWNLYAGLNAFQIAMTRFPCLEVIELFSKYDDDKTLLSAIIPSYNLKSQGKSILYSLLANDDDESDTMKMVRLLLEHVKHTTPSILAPIKIGELKGYTPFHFITSIYCDNEKMLTVLLEYGEIAYAKIPLLNEGTFNGFDAFDLAIYHGNLGQVKKFLQKNRNFVKNIIKQPNRTYFNFTPLHLAVERKHLEIVELLLLQYGKDIDIKRAVKGNQSKYNNHTAHEIANAMCNKGILEIFNRSDRRKKAPIIFKAWYKENIINDIFEFIIQWI